MKKLTVWLLVIFTVLTGLWFGAEAWLSARARSALVGAQDVSAGTIRPLRQPGRFGLHFEALSIGDEAQMVNAPELDAYVSLFSPTTLSLDLPDQLTLHQAGQPVDLGMKEGKASASVSPIKGLALSRIEMKTEDLAVDGSDALGGLNIRAELTHMGSGAPQGSVAAYMIAVKLDELVIANLTERMSISGPVQVWLSSLPAKAVLDGTAPPPALTGLQMTGMKFSLGKLEAKVLGQLIADENGFAEGEAALYTKDGEAFVDAAIHAGMIPEGAVHLAKLMVRKLTTARQVIARRKGGDPQDAGTKQDADQSAPTEAGLAVDPEAAIADLDNIDRSLSLPPAGPGEIHLPLIFRDGRTWFGPLPLGPAPQLAAAR
ncbi:MAG: DUF2125 domain-containing protein [Paracoccus sp. (in: a-proteobacteria)]